MHPHTVDDHARRQRVGFARYALREFEATAALFEAFPTTTRRENFEKAARNEIATRLGLAANKDGRVVRILAVGNHHGLGGRIWIGHLQLVDCGKVEFAPAAHPLRPTLNGFPEVLRAEFVGGLDSERRGGDLQNCRIGCQRFRLVVRGPDRLVGIFGLRFDTREDLVVDLDNFLEVFRTLVAEGDGHDWVIAVSFVLRDFRDLLRSGGTVVAFRHIHERAESTKDRAVSVDLVANEASELFIEFLFLDQFQSGLKERFVTSIAAQIGCGHVGPRLLAEGPRRFFEDVVICLSVAFFDGCNLGFKCLQLFRIRLVQHRLVFGLHDARKDSMQRVVVLRGDRVEHVIVAAGAGYREAHEAF